MTLPSSPFPRTHCISLDKPCNDTRCPVHFDPWPPRDMVCAVHVEAFRRQRGCPACRFPLLRSSSLWRQTWLECSGPFFEPTHYGFNAKESFYDPRQGHWFPPLECKHRERTLRKRFYGRGFRGLPMLYTVDNCPDCTAALQAVELMVYGVAKFLADEPEQWEHRCWFGERANPYDLFEQQDCTCGAGASLTDLQSWRQYAESVIAEWAASNDGGPIRGFHWSWAGTDEPIDDIGEILSSLTSTVDTSGADLTIENLLEAQRQLLGHKPQ